MQVTYFLKKFPCKTPLLTSRDKIYEKKSYFIKIKNDKKTGLGEASFLKGLSPDCPNLFEENLAKACNALENNTFFVKDFLKFPAIIFACQMAQISYKSFDPYIFYPSNFTKGKTAIKTNALIWMGSYSYMFEQINVALNKNPTCIKIKIGSIDFAKEYLLIKNLRKKNSSIQIRLDANGAYTKEQFLNLIMPKLADLNIHSIEQPIKSGQILAMKEVCAKSKIDIALDEELIGIYSKKEKENLLKKISPQFIILKPSLLGGVEQTKQWANAAKNQGIDFWLTSMLESNIALNFIAQFAYTLKPNSLHGLGTGNLYLQNMQTPLIYKNYQLFYQNNN